MAKSETTKSVRGWGLSLSLLIWKRRVTISIMPLVFNALLITKAKQPFPGPGVHIVAGPFHIWTMETDTILGFEIDADYNHFWYDHPVCPSSHEQVYP